jgi:hypothetical protein
MNEAHDPIIDIISEGMKPLFERAEAEGLWFRSNYQGLWFSPEALRDHQANGKFRWGAVNWKLLPYSQYLLEEELPAMERKVMGWGKKGGFAMVANLMDAIVQLKAALADQTKVKL